MRARAWPALALLFGAALAAPGCVNLWSWTVDDASFEAAFEEGRSALRAADYPRAETAFTRAVELRPTHREARYYLAKASVLRSGIDVLALVRHLTDDQAHGAADVFAYDTPSADAIYRVNARVLDALEPIRSGTATEGGPVASDVDLDVAIAYSLRAILRLRDTNGDGVIDGRDVSIADFSLNQGDDFSLEGLANVPPEDLNSMIDDLTGLAGDGGDALVDALSGSGIDTDELDELLDSLGGDVSMYYVNTGVPGNPGLGDNDGDGRVDEECLNGDDDDGDGRVDEDGRAFGCG
jgi:hypothetical protein